MKKYQSPSEEILELRRRAEERLREASAEQAPRTPLETQKLLHELEVHQIELEMQNAELRQAREEMEQMLERCTDLYDFVPVGYFTLDPDGVIRAVNIAGAALLGVERKLLPGRGFEAFVFFEVRSAFTSFLAQVFASGGKETLDLVLAPLQEGNAPLFVRIDAVANSTGRECRIAAIDITKRRQAEEELARYREHLEGLVRERTASLEAEISERRRAEQEIKELNAHLEQLVADRTSELQSTVRDLRTFSYSISHDLRAPLRGINSFAAMLLEDFGGALDEEGRRLIGTIVKRTVSMGKLIDDLLMFSQNSMQQLAVKPIDMTALARELVGKLFSDLPDGSVEFKIEELPQARGDRSMIAQVLENLLSNAVKFSGKVANPIIEVGSTAAEKQNVYFVKDNGIGFDMKYVDTIFGVFQRLHNSEDFEGTGVGLAIVEQIVTKHGGRAGAVSTLGEGATFFFSLPKP